MSAFLPFLPRILFLAMGCGMLLRAGRLEAENKMLRGAETVIVGIQPEVAFAMVQLGLTLEGVATALDLEEGLAYLNEKFKTTN